MKITFHAHGWEDYLHWQSQDRKLLQKLNGLIRECQRTPFTGTGKPEPLKGELAGWWSRRIDQEHRLVYRVTDEGLLIAQCRYHYAR
jgi:toxin YoeB